MRRPTILVGVASDTRNDLCAELEAAGFPVAIITSAADLDGTLRGTPGIGAAILDADSNIETALAQADRLAAEKHAIPTLMIAGGNQLEQIAARPDGGAFDYVLPPYSADSLRWRVEAMCIRTQTALEGVRTLNDAWRDVPEGGVPDSFLEVATNHASGMKVLALTLSPLHTEML